MRLATLLTISIVYGGMLAASPFKVDGNNIFYDTADDGIEFGHEEELLKILKNHPEITKIILNSYGGSIAPAEDMSNLIIDANLDTHVEYECASACATIFLGGKSRSLALGGKLGFHKSYWKAEDIADYYENEKEAQEWEDPFQFASWLYEDTQAEMFAQFEYLLERGVAPSFAIETLKAGSDGMWYPRRKQLLEGGVLTK